MRIVMAAALFASMIGATAAQAQITTFSTRGAFNTAAGPTTAETFQSCNSGTSLATNASAASACSSLAPGISFTPDAGAGFYIAAPGQSANATIGLGINFPAQSAYNIGFAAGSASFGGDFNQNTGGGAQSGSPILFTLQAFAVGGASLGSFNFSVASGASTFFGLTSGTLLGSVRVFSTRDYAVLDNVAFNGRPGAVPEPATWAMMLLGFGLIGAIVRRRRSGLVARTA